MPASKSEYISSPANPLLKEVRKAAARGTLTDSGCMLAETFHLLEEALSSECRVRTVIAAQSVSAAVDEQLGDPNGVRLVVVPDSLLQAAAGVEAAQGVVALVEPPRWSLERMLRKPQLTLVIDGVQDPGNLGTILRSAEAFGASGVLLLKGTVSPFNPKVVRASAGSIFRAPFLHGLDETDALAALHGQGVQIYAAVPHTDSSRWLSTADLTRACAIVIGSEGSGVNETLRHAATEIAIPTVGVESLNAAVAASVLLYEARRQRARHK
jgi:TrmH family RNA methyltransferase